MPPKTKKRVSDDYDDDDGFVVDSKQTTKRVKTERLMPDTDVPGNGAKDEEGSEYWEISKNRRLTISVFKGKHMVNIREYYEKDGKNLPGKKGISLPIEQYAAFVALLPHVETVLKEKGEDVPRPVYGDSSEAEGADDGDEPENVVERTVKKGNAGNSLNGGKKNFEATSDEEEGDDDG
ncbi:MAG: hypothetical protein M1837_000210 [Sclerophora amabilis]|nr:MAG: hypothetical protein M1837_000210 [Sclerophora amabilis]